MPLTIEEIMEKMPGALDSQKAAGINAVVHFKFTGAEAGEWNAIIKDGKAEVARGIPHSKPTVTLTADSSDFLQLFTGKLDPMQAFMQGKIKLGGDLSQAMKLVPMFRVS